MSNWEEDEFSGDEYLSYRTPVKAEWLVSVNRYGQPKARLFFMGDAGGPMVLETKLDLTESASNEELAAAAQAWATSVVEDGTALRMLMFPPMSAEELAARDALDEAKED